MWYWLTIMHNFLANTASQGTWKINIAVPIGLFLNLSKFGLDCADLGKIRRQLLTIFWYPSSKNVDSSLQL